MIARNWPRPKPPKALPENKSFRYNAEGHQWFQLFSPRPFCLAAERPTLAMCSALDINHCDSMRRTYDIFEAPLNGRPVWRAAVAGHEAALARMRELAANSPNEFRLVHVESRSVAAVIEAKQGTPVASPRGKSNLTLVRSNEKALPGAAPSHKRKSAAGNVRCNQKKPNSSGC